MQKKAINFIVITFEQKLNNEITALKFLIY